MRVTTQRNFGVAVITACALSAGGYAQSTPTPSDPTPSSTPSTQTPSTQTPSSQTPSSQSGSRPDSTVTIQGCVARDTAAGASTAAYKLTDAQMGANGATSSARSSSSTSSAASTMSADEFKLDAGSSVNLSQHVNQKVEITGTLSPSANGASSSMSSSNSTTNRSTSTESPSLRVTSVRMIAASCK